MRLRATLIALVAALALALLASGCGGGDEASSVGAESAATIAPSSAVAYVSVNTDLDSDQWENLNALLEQFPGRERLVSLLRESFQEESGLRWEDLRAAAGPTLEFVVLRAEDEGDVVVLLQPKDEDAFRRLLDAAEKKPVTREIEGWTALAESETELDRFEQGSDAGTLADEELFEELMAELPAEALAKGWFDADGLTDAASKQLGAQTQLGALQPDAASVAVEAVDDGMRMLVHVRNGDVDVDAPEFGELAERVPADAFAFVNGHGFGGRLNVTEQLRGLPGFEMSVGQAERAIGVTLEDLSTLFNEEMVLWARPGMLIPEVTLVLEVDDEAHAKQTVDRLVAAAGALGQVRSRERTVGDVEATQVDLDQFAILYAVFDGKLVVTTQASGIEALTEDVDRLVDEGRYEDTVEAAGVGDDEQVLTWVDLERALDVVDTFAGLAGKPLPRDVRENVEPLDALVLSADPSPEDGSIRLFLHVR